MLKTVMKTGRRCRMQTIIDFNVVSICKTKLISIKQDLLNRFLNHKLNFDNYEKNGDEIDQAVATLHENNFVTTHERMRKQLFEIEQALARIENNTFGFCEETNEPIEIERLLAIPWTTLSIEGAELRESLEKRHARR